MRAGQPVWLSNFSINSRCLCERSIHREPQKGENKTCLHVHFPASLASHPLTWCNDKEIILATLAIGGVDWGRRGGQRLGGEQSVGGERGLADSELLFLLRAPLLHRVHAPKWSGTGPFHRLHPLRWADSPSVFYKLLCKQFQGRRSSQLPPLSLSKENALPKLFRPRSHRTSHADVGHLL